MIPCIHHSGKGGIVKEKNTGCQGLGVLERRTTKGHGGILWPVGTVLYLYCHGGCTTAHICQNSQNCPLKGENFVVCK